MSLSTEGAFPWHTSYHYLQPIHKASVEEIDINHFSFNENNTPVVPESILEDNLESAATHVQPSFMKPPPNSNQETTQLKRSGEKNKGNFHWGDLKKGSSKDADNRQDDGVVLLVGIFNLLAVVVYAAQEFLAGSSKGKDKRVVLWQVQKVLDELVLRVHSSETASNLLSRALKSSSSRSTSGRNIDKISISSILQDALQESDPLKLRSWLDNAKNKLIEELSNIPESDLGPRIDPRIYRPLQNLYYKATETTRRGRSFSSSLLQEASSVARTMSHVSLKDVQSILVVMSKLGRMQKRYDVLPMLKTILPLAFPASILEQEHQFSPKPESEVGRQRRSALYPPFRVMRKLRQRQNSRSLQMSDKMKPQHLQVDNSQQQLGNSGTIMKKQGIVESLEYDELPGNWADKWFSLLTQVSPIALDFTNLYSNSRTQPYCVRALLCKSNKYWKKRGTLHAAITPFLSVIASWALEDSSPHTLGDSLIAVRAGWMEKECQNIYPECQEHGKVKILSTFDLSPSPSRPQNQVIDSSSSNFVSKSGEVFSTGENDKLVQTVEPSSEINHQIQHIDSSPNNLDAQIYHAPQPSLNLINQNNQDDLPFRFEEETSQEREEPQSNNVVLYNHRPHYSEDESGSSVSPHQNLFFGDSQTSSDKIGTIHPQLISQVYQNSYQHPQSFQINGVSSNNQKTNQKLVGSETSVPFQTNIHTEEHLNDHEKNIFVGGSDVHDEGFQKKNYERYDRPETDDEMDYLMSSGSVSGMALQDRLVDRKKILVSEEKERNPSNKNDDNIEAQVNYTSSKNKFEILHEVRDSDHDVRHIKSQNRMPPWAKEGAAAAFLSQPSYSNYIVSQIPAFLKPTTKPPVPHKTKKREPVSYPVISPLGFPKYKYGVRRGLPAGNVGGNGLLESTDNELFSSSLKYKKKQSLQPQSLALIAAKNSPLISAPKSNKNMKLKKNSALKPPAKSSKSASAKSSKPAPAKPSKLITVKPPKIAPTKPSKQTPVKPSTFGSAESKEVSQFGPADAITDAHRNEILHQYVRDRQI